ncbi:interferon-induced protein 44-like isoform X1 [Mercenaria mercenaria]|uniref:interferon-induced protein 44-like isoform X1 n=1 Tax=Mercenaria mercenaria TaxID=6596 RepID=UPI00234E4A71|nr:interferon-induced protein 44-like isoform X1 [Mercenaria mercenaria]
MGNSGSETAKDLTDEPWRKMKTLVWNEKYCKELKDEINKFEKVWKSGSANCLLLGPTSVGQSAFINSVLSISKGRLCEMAYTADGDWGSVTKEYFSFQGGDEMKCVNMFDTSGLMEGPVGFNVENIISLIDGHVKSGYTFNPASPIQISDACYVSKPSEKDKIHCAAFIMNAQLQYDDLGEKYLNKIRTLQKALMEKDVPRVVILTKCDILCNEVEKNTGCIYRSTKVKEAVERARDWFLIPANNVYPVVNYGGGQKIELELETSVPILLALRHITYAAADFLEKSKLKSNQAKSSDAEALNS